MGGTVHGALRSLGAPPHRAVPVRRPWGCPLRTHLPAAPRRPSLQTLLPAAGPRSRSGQSGSRRTRRHADWPGRSWEHCGEKGHVLSPRSCAGRVQEAGLQDHPGRHRRKESHTPWHRDTHPRRRTTQCSQKPAGTVSQTEMLAGGAGARHGGRASGCPVPSRPHGGALSKGREPWVLRPAPGKTPGRGGGDGPPDASRAAASACRALLWAAAKIPVENATKQGPEPLPAPPVRPRPSGARSLAGTGGARPQRCQPACRRPGPAPSQRHEGRCLPSRIEILTLKTYSITEYSEKTNESTKSG